MGRGEARAGGQQAMAEAFTADLRMVVGLGNPGVEYAFTPHNFGFLLVDELAQRSGARLSVRECQALTGRGRLAGSPLVLAKPETYMNLSGVAVRELLRKHECEPSQMLVVYDDLDLALGTLRLRERGSAGTHNGMRSIVQTLGTEMFPRLRLGIGAPHPIQNLKNYVLTPWKKSQLETVQEVLVRAAEVVEMILRDGLLRAMNVCNTRPQAQPETGTQSRQSE